MSEERAIYNVGMVKPTSLDAFKGRACTLPFSHPDYRPPEPYEVAALTELLGWSQVRTANLVGVKGDPKKGSTTIRKWKTESGDERRRIPYSAWRLMLLYAGVVSIEEGLAVGGRYAIYDEKENYIGSINPDGDGFRIWWREKRSDPPRRVHHPDRSLFATAEEASSVVQQLNKNYKVRDINR